MDCIDPEEILYSSFEWITDEIIDGYPIDLPLEFSSLHGEDDASNVPCAPREQRAPLFCCQLRRMFKDSHQVRFSLKLRM